MLNISNNPKWAQSQNYSELLCGILLLSPNLKELDFDDEIRGSPDQVNLILQTIYDTGVQVQIKKLDISNNPKLTQSENFLSPLCGILS